MNMAATAVILETPSLPSLRPLFFGIVAAFYIICFGWYYVNMNIVAPNFQFVHVLCVFEKIPHFIQVIHTLRQQIINHDVLLLYF